MYVPQQGHEGVHKQFKDQHERKTDSVLETRFLLDDAVIGIGLCALES